MNLTPARCEEIVRQSQELVEYGPWSDQIDKILTSEEKAEINLHWSSLPSDASFIDAFNNFRYNRIGEAG